MVTTQRWIEYLLHGKGYLDGDDDLCINYFERTRMESGSLESFRDLLSYQPID
jgi:hypothetical protein